MSIDEYIYINIYTSPSICIPFIIRTGSKNCKGGISILTSLSMRFLLLFIPFASVPGFIFVSGFLTVDPNESGHSARAPLEPVMPLIKKKYS
jgi:hypothetical protein